MARFSNSEIESAIRSIIKNLYQTGNLDDLTVKRVRAATEKELKLPDRWFRDHEEWKDRSDSFIKSTAQALADDGPPDEGAGASDVAEQSADSSKVRRTNKRASEESEILTNKRAKKTTALSQAIPTQRTKQRNIVKPVSKSIGKDRSVSTEPKRAKKNKSVIESDDDDDDDNEEDDEENHEGRSGDREDEDMKDAGEDKSEKPPQADQDEQHQSESELSSLLDDGPPPKRRESAKSQQPEDKKTKASKTKETDPKQEEIKKLKDWLKKCGINKRWLEVDKMGSEREKVSYLKKQLADAGMEGRYSLAKANQIREERELQEEIEEAQKFEKAWGNKKPGAHYTSAADAMADMGLDVDDSDDD